MSPLARGAGMAPASLEPWHALDEAAVVAMLDSPEPGLDPRQAAARLERYGENALPEPEPPGLGP